MDYELEQNHLLCYETVGQASVCQEETQEAIVPDACPDILRIVDVTAQAYLNRCEAKEGQAAVFGKIQAVVLYLPEQGLHLQRVPLQVPFVVQADIQGMTASDVIQAAVTLRRADARILNPRKLLLRCDVAAEIEVLTKNEYRVSEAVKTKDPHVCQRQERFECEHIVCVPQRIFPVSEEIRLTGTQPPMLLSGRGRVVCSESRIIGSKLIFKGKFDADLLLQDQDGAFERRTETFPFSQILDAKEAGEGNACNVRLQVCEFACTQLEEDPFLITLDGEVLASSRVWNRSSVVALTDVYSTSHQLQLEQQAMCIHAPCEQVVTPQTLRDLLETKDLVRSVSDSRFDLGQLQAVRDGSTLNLTVQGQITVLYLNEERQPECVTKEVSISARVAAAAERQLTQAYCEPGELFAAPCTGGIEVRLSVDFYTNMANLLSFSSITGAAQVQPRDPEGTRPSAILRLPEPGETLWDIAKACGTTREQIMQANEMAEENLSVQRMLLIPSVR